MDLAERFDTIEKLISKDRVPEWLPRMRFSVSQVANVIGVSDHTLRRHIHSGYIECNKDGSTYWFDHKHMTKAAKKLGIN